MRTSLPTLVAVLALLAGCAGGDDDGGSATGSAETPSPAEQAEQGQPVLGQRGDEEPAGPALGFPVFATANTTRVGGADPVANAAGVAQAAFPSRSEDTRPRAVVLVDQDDWRAGIAAAQLSAAPLRAPVLLTEGDELPEATADALEKLQPTGAEEAGDAQVIRIGEVAEPEGLKSTDVTGKTAAETAARIDALLSAARGRTSDRVVIAASERPEFAMPAAGWAAKSGDPVLFTDRNQLPAATREAIARHQQPKIYILGPPNVISPRVARELRRLGTVRRVAGPDPVANAVAFARFADGRFGWGVIDPGHGLVFASTRRPLDAAAAAPLSASGTYAPLLLVEGRGLPRALVAYLLDIQPGYDRDPVRAVYNHGWIMGDAKVISVADQARIDALLEIVPVNTTQGRNPRP